MNNLSGNVNGWTGATTDAPIAALVVKEKLNPEKYVDMLNDLRQKTESLLETYNTLYDLHADSDLGACITRLDQNIGQLKKIKRGLID